MISKAFKFRIYPTPEQIKSFDDSFRTSRFIYNYCLRQQIDISDKMTEIGIVDKKERNKYMKDNNLYFNRYEMSKILTQMGNTDEFWFLKNIDSTSKTYSLKAIEKAFANIKKMGSGFPKFKNQKSKHSFTGQIQYNENKPKTFNLKLLNNKFGLIDIPKIKKIKISCHNHFFSENWDNNKFIKINSYTISRKNDKYFISLQCDVNDPNKLIIETKKPIDKKTSVGIDFGVHRPITTSDELHFNIDIYKNSISLLKQYKSELHRLSKILNRKRDYHKKNKTDINFWETTSYKRIKKKINNLYFKITEKRDYIQHCISKSLIELEDVDTYILEDLNLKGMMKRSGKGKSNNKSNLNRVLSDVGLYSLRTKMQYKAEYVGKNVVTVNPKHTSQKCSKCGHTNKLNRQTQSKFICVICGHTMNADLNAAINIKEKYFENK
jgi:putative transposase